MPEFIIAYKGGDQPESEEAGKAHFAKWQAWLQGLGEAAVKPATPMRDVRLVSRDGVSDAPRADTMSGFTIVQADNLDDALEMAKSCPFLDINGTLEVGQLMEMPG